MSGIYITPGIPTGGGGGGTSTDVANTSTVPGATVTDALNNVQADLNVAQTVQYIPTAPITLSAGNISDKYIVLPSAPRDKDKTYVNIVHGVAGLYGTDFIITSDDADRRLSWAGLGFDGLLAAGDIMLVAYN